MKEWSPVMVACLMMCACRGNAYSRIMALNSRSRGASVFRPGATVLRPNWAAPPPHPRYMQAASKRSPYVYYKSPHSPLGGSGSSRYVKPHYNKFGGYVSGPWHATVRLPSTSPAYEFVRVSASTSTTTPLRVDGDRGPIYTIPAPNLSLADKPIVVMDSQYSHLDYSTASSDILNKTRVYEVTEKTIDPMSLNIGSKFVASPSGPQAFTYSNAPSLTSPEVLELMRNSAQQFQLSDTYPLPILQQPQLLRHTALGPHLTLQGFNAIMQPSTGTDLDSIQQNILFKPDPNYIHKISNQLYQRYPGVDFYQYPVEVNTQAHMLIIPDENKDASEHMNVIRATDEGTIMALVPKVIPVTVTSTTAHAIQNASTTTEPTTVISLNFTTSEVTTAKEEVTSTTEAAKDTPIYYPKIGENVGSIVASGFYSALTDVRAAEALASIEKSEHDNPLESKTEQTTIASHLKPDLFQSTIKEENKTETKTNIVKPHPGSPFTKSEPTNNVAYSFLRREGDSKTDITKDGVRLAGQIVEASISDDEDFNHEKAALHRRPQLRLYSYETMTEKPRKSESKPKPKINKSKLTFDSKTGEPVIRIYAQQPNSKPSEEREPQGFTTKKSNKNDDSRASYPNVRSSTPNAYEGWKSSTVKLLEHTSLGSDLNQITQFGLKLRPRMDDYISIFEYDEE